MSTQEHVLLVDEKDTTLGVTDKATVHTNDTPLHRAFSLFLYDTNGRLLLQQRAASKKTWPGVWSNSVCGHPQMNEPYEEAAQRRLKYELGITIDLDDIKMMIPDYKYRYEFQGVVEHEFCPVLVAIQDVAPKPNPLEVMDVRWVAWSNFLEEIQCPNAYSEWCVEEAQLLADSPEFQSLIKSKVK